MAMPVAAARIDNAAYAQRARKMQFFFLLAYNMLPKINAFKDRHVMHRVIYNSPLTAPLGTSSQLRAAIYAIFKYGRRLLSLKAKAEVKVVKFSRSFA